MLFATQIEKLRTLKSSNKRRKGTPPKMILRSMSFFMSFLGPKWNPLRAPFTTRNRYLWVLRRGLQTDVDVQTDVQTVLF